MLRSNIAQNNVRTRSNRDISDDRNESTPYWRFGCCNYGSGSNTTQRVLRRRRNVCIRMSAQSVVETTLRWVLGLAEATVVS